MVAGKSVNVKSTSGSVNSEVALGLESKKAEKSSKLRELKTGLHSFTLETNSLDQISASSRLCF